MRMWMVVAACGALAAAPLCGQTVATDQAEPAPASVELVPPPSVLPALTPVRIEILEPINSQKSRIGTRFPIRLAAAIPLPGGTEIPAGITGEGQVVHAAKSRLGGRPGELILAARYLDYGTIRIPLRSFSFTESVSARNNDDLAFAVSTAAAPLGLFITGGEVDVPAGSLAFAKTSAPVELAAAPTSTPQQGEIGP